VIAWMFGRMAAIRQAWPVILIISLVHGGGQLALTLWNPVLSNFLAATAALAIAYPLSRWDRYSEPAEGIDERPAIEDVNKVREEDEDEPIMGLGWALLPYIILTITSIIVLVIPQIESFLQQFEFGLGFPGVETGYEVVREAEDPYSPITPLTHPGTFLLISAFITWLIYRGKNYYKKWSQSEQGILSKVVSDAIPSSVAVLSFLILSRVMDHSGQITVLAQGIANVAPPAIYAFAANWIGVLGAFMTSSNTASNVLFAPLQQQVAISEGISEATIIAAQSTGGAIGNAIAPANVVLGTGTTGILGREGDVLRKTLPYALGVAVLVGLLTIPLMGLNLF
jgi:lactate permease